MRVLVLCTGNSCRSQMAEALLRAKVSSIEAFSAGVKPANSVNPLSVIVLQELNLPTEGLFPKDVSYFDGQEFDLVVTVCDHAREICPHYSRTKRQSHKSFDDPYYATGSHEEKLMVYRRVRDEIAAWIDELVVTNVVA